MRKRIDYLPEVAITQTIVPLIFSREKWGVLKRITLLPPSITCIPVIGLQLLKFI